MKVKVYTRSKDGDIWDKMKLFIPEEIECERVWGYDHWKGALYYLLDLLDSDADYVVNVDIDCFIFNWKGVEKMIEQMGEYGFAFSGMPDTFEICPHRYGLYEHTNPFFNVFDVKKCKQVIDTMSINSLNRFEKEPFEKFFEALYWKENRLEIATEQHQDGISTIIPNMAIHTWYSRDEEHRERINHRFEEAKRLWEKNKSK